VYEPSEEGGIKLRVLLPIKRATSGDHARGLDELVVLKLGI
jgi:hypothetical protein